MSPCYFRLSAGSSRKRNVPEIPRCAQNVSGAETGNCDRQLAVFGAAIYPCRAIEVIAVSAVNSGPNNPAGASLSLSPPLLPPLSLCVPRAFSGSRSRSPGSDELRLHRYFAFAARESRSLVPRLRAPSTGPYTKDEHKDNHISRTYILAAYQSWTLTTGVRSWRLTMAVMTGYSRGHRRTAALNHPSREWFHPGRCGASDDTYLGEGIDFRSRNLRSALSPRRT